MIYSSEIICDYLKQRDRKGIKLLFEVYYKPLVLWADTFLNDISRSEDLVQDFFLKLWEQELGNYLQPDTLKSYLYTSIRNRALNLLDKNDPLRLAYELELEDRIWEEYDDGWDEMFCQVESAMNKLAPRSREVVELVYLKNMKYKEVAILLNISLATVKTLLVNALKKLRKECHSENKILFYFFMRNLNKC